MTFPLPQGVCRKVCRPVRRPARVIRAAEVFRIARAAKRNGEGPCTILSSAYRAVPELKYPEKLDEASLALIESAQKVNDIVTEVLEDLVTLRGGRILLPWRVIQLIYDIYQLVSALNELSDAQVESVSIMRSVSYCLEPNQP